MGCVPIKIGNHWYTVYILFWNQFCEGYNKGFFIHSKKNSILKNYVIHWNQLYIFQQNFCQSLITYRTYPTPCKYVFKNEKGFFKYCKGSSVMVKENPWSQS